MMKPCASGAQEVPGEFRGQEFRGVPGRVAPGDRFLGVG